MLGVKYWTKTISYSQEKIKGLPLRTFDLYNFLLQLVLRKS